MEIKKRKFLKYSKLFDIDINEFYEQEEKYYKGNRPFTLKDVILKVLKKYKIITSCKYHLDYCIIIKKIKTEYNIKIKNKYEFKVFMHYKKYFNPHENKFRLYLKLYQKLNSYLLAAIFVKNNINKKNYPHIYYYFIDKNIYNKKFKNKKYIEKFNINYFQYLNWLKIYKLQNTKLNAKKYIIIKKYDLYHKNKKLYFRLSFGYQNWQKEYQKWKESIKQTKESFIKRYGEKLGIQKFNEFKYKSGYKHTKEYFVKTFGKKIGLQKWKELNNKKRLSLENMIRKYGEEEGKKKWKAFCEKNSYTNSIEYYIETYGKEEGTKRYEKWKSATKTLRIEYWIEKGYSEKEAKEKLAERQATNRLDKFIEREGPIKGYIKWHNRQLKWLNTLNSKTEEEKREINKKKAITLENMIKKYGKEEGIKRYEMWLKSIIPAFYSKESIKFLNPIYDYLISLGFKDEDIYWKENEYFIYDKKQNKIRFFDFTIPKLKLTIEYNGSIWHYNPNYDYPKDFKNPLTGVSLNELKENDNYKRQLAIDNGFKIIEVFDTDNKEEKQKEIINIIKNLYYNFKNKKELNETYK